MRGKATIIEKINCSASPQKVGVVVTAFSIGILPKGLATGMKPISGSAIPTKQTSLKKWLDVTPTQPQSLIWLVPQYGIDYQVKSNTNWKVK